MYASAETCAKLRSSKKAEKFQRKIERQNNRRIEAQPPQSKPAVVVAIPKTTIVKAIPKEAPTIIYVAGKYLGEIQNNFDKISSTGAVLLFDPVMKIGTQSSAAVSVYGNYEARDKAIKMMGNLVKKQKALHSLPSEMVTVPNLVMVKLHEKMQDIVTRTGVTKIDMKALVRYQHI
uniref:Uncharacterized protein n=1 Tax=Panagrolaimus sp. PS1159 TaxID=55785 RepID=A0AC35GTC4_9BILA